MISSARVYYEGIKTSLLSRMAYRGDFLISITMLVIVEMAAPVLTLLIYNTGASFPDWSFYEVVLLQGIFLISKGIAFSFFFGMVGLTLGGVNNGTFDLILLKPRSPFLVMSSTSFDIESAGQLIAGIWLFMIAFKHLPAPGVSQWLVFAILMVISIAAFMSFALIMSGIVIKWVGCGRVFDIFSSVTTFGQYPRTIYSKLFRSLITWVFPIAAMAFLPAAVLLGKEASGIYQAGAASAVFLLFSYIFWNMMLKSYTSAGG